MKIIECDEFIFTGADKRQSAADITYDSRSANGKLILLLHGFKSFKNWGCWPWFAANLAAKGYVVIKPNFSHNGVGITENQLEDFVDLEAFGNNNFSKQLQDIDLLLQHLENMEHPAISSAQLQSITCIGHSMGGGMAILATAAHSAITNLITLNSMSDFHNLLKHFDAAEWQKNDVVYVDNARTKQQMPLYYQLLTDYTTNKTNLDIVSNSAKITVPWLWIYSAQDETVAPKSIAQIQQVQPNIKTHCIEGSGHTFDATHPHTNASDALKQVLEQIITFLA
jgi:uncharacterized protein